MGLRKYNVYASLLKNTWSPKNNYFTEKEEDLNDRVKIHLVYSESNWSIYSKFGRYKNTDTILQAVAYSRHLGLNLDCSQPLPSLFLFVMLIFNLHFSVPLDFIFLYSVCSNCHELRFFLQCFMTSLRFSCSESLLNSASHTLTIHFSPPMAVSHTDSSLLLHLLIASQSSIKILELFFSIYFPTLFFFLYITTKLPCH